MNTSIRLLRDLLFKSPAGKIFLLSISILFFLPGQLFAGVKPAVKDRREIEKKLIHKKGGTPASKASGILALPTISYAGPQVYTAGTAVALTPASSGVLAAGYNSGTVNYSAGFTNPRGIARDAAGNVYVADYGNSTVVKIAAANGAVSSIGSGFNGPTGVAVDGFGNVYVADYGNNAIKEIPVHTTNTVTVGSGFSSPFGVAADAQGNVYVADYGNQAVKKIPVGGGAPIYLGNALNFKAPSGVAVDAAGNVYVTDITGGNLQEIPAAGGGVITIATGFSSPYGVAIDASGNLFIADLGSASIKEVPVGGGLVVLSSAFNTVTGVVCDGAGNLLVSDYGNTAIQLLAPSGGYYLNNALPAGLIFNNTTGIISGVPQVASLPANYTVTAYNASGQASATVNIRVVLPQAPSITYGSAKTYTSGTAITNLVPTTSRVAAAAYSNNPETIATGFQNPNGVALDANDNIYTADFNTGILYEIPDGGGPPEILATGLNNPTGVAADEDGNVFVSSSNANSVSRVPAGGGTITTVGSGYNNPRGVAVDGNGNVYVTNYGSNYVDKVPAGTNSEVILNSSAQNPLGVTVDASGNVYFTDTNNGGYSLVKIPVAGGPASVIATGFFDPVGLTTDLAGNVYVADELYNAIKKIPANGGAPVTISSGVLYPAGIAIDEAGNLFVSDGGVEAIKKIVPTGGYFITPALPAGLMFDSNTGIISGTPLAPSSATDYIVTAYNTGGGTEAIISIKVNAPAVPTISYTGPNTYTAGITITPLTPTSARVAAPLYSNSPVAIASGFNNVGGLARDAAGNIYVADIDNLVVKKIPAGGGPVTTIGTGFGLPVAVAVDASGDVFVADRNNNAVIELPAGGGAKIPVGSGYNAPNCIAIDAAGNIYVTNNGNNTVNKIPAGTTTPVVIGSGFSSPSGICVDASGNIYVGETGDVKEIPAAGGPIVTLASGFFDAAALTTDAAGNIYVTDELNSALKVIPAGGGTPVIISQGVLYPDGIVLDAAGNLYVSDNGINAVDKIVPTGGYFISPALPSGLIFNSATGVISGTPLAAKVATNYTIKAYNSGGGGTTTVNIKVVASSNATLAGLVISQGTLSPAFAAATTSYTAPVANSVTAITVIPTTSFSGATVKVNGATVISGEPSANIALAVGNNTITTIVKAQDGVTTQTYTITITRAASSNANLAALTPSKGTLSPAFATATNTYTDMVTNGTTSITVTPTLADATATITVNGTPVKSGSPSGAIALSVGANTITTVVTAQDGVTTNTYTLTVVRPSTNAKLSALSISTGTLTPAFNTNTNSYTATVNMSSITVTPTAAVTGSTITVDGTAVTSGSASAAIALIKGGNNITVVVTAQDGVTTDTYTLTITSTVSTNANLSGLSPSKGTLSPAFAAATTSYTDMVTNGTTSITVTPTVADATATVTVNGTAVSSGKASGAIALSVGNNAIATVVTAQDGTTQITYTINVIRPSTNAKLSNLTTNAGAITPVFNPATTSYTLSVTNATASITITPTVAVTGETVTINGVAVPSGSPSGAIALSVGSNTVTTIVTAQDGVTTDTYTLTVTRAASTGNIPDATVSVEGQNFEPLLADYGINVHQGISPNGDGINDYLQIDNITNYPENHLKIMNRNGQLIYEAKGYDNAAKAFDGHSNKNGQMQLPGTYFYELDYIVKGIVIHKTGYLVLKY